MNDITLITTHFKEFRWFHIWLRQIIKSTPPEIIREILVIDQDRTEESRRKLANMDKRIRVLQYPVSSCHFSAVGHDHANVLNETLPQAKGEIICLFDSDAYPINDSWVQHCDALLRDNDAILAACHDNPAYSHPCFMVLRRNLVTTPLSFDDGLFTRGIDTGRHVVNQLREQGAKVALVQPSVGFSGCWGSLYLKSIYHHGSGSFHAGSKQFTSQLSSLHHYFTRRVFNETTYTLSGGEKIAIRLIYFFCYGLRIRIRLFNDKFQSLLPWKSGQQK